ncbi:YdcF family protein [Kitasatospora sp. NBC_01287]|uniref:YdcF family protein n=1 Tax=Kitasatospora sp. NBC_01287 TaxID=2903573 RepID=UPI002259C162|nr:YdcF family protein [Kitasatospora sp. NBC_01287]MCX4744032.1 YdcF family protein [Kitasatospora sp. NBC_01287]
MSAVIPVALLALSALFALLFAHRTRRDRRRFGNAVLLGLALGCLLLAGALGGFGPLPDEAHTAVLAVLPLLVGASAVATAVLLVANGITMLRREGGGPANLLSLVAGLAAFGVLGLLAAAVSVDSRPLRAAAAAVLLVAGYFSFLLLCFVGYAALYARLTVRREVDFVVVLGAGLVDGHRVPPLLAARLERGLGVQLAQARWGRVPPLVLSGGKGTDESRSEAAAMADFLTGRGVAPELLRREDRSTSTEENLKFSDALMAAERPGYRCLIVTSSFHVLRSAILARRAGVRGQVLGAPTAAYYWPSAMLREFVAVLLCYPVATIGPCVLLALLGAVGGWHG